LFFSWYQIVDIWQHFSFQLYAMAIRIVKIDLVINMLYDQVDGKRGEK